MSGDPFLDPRTGVFRNRLGITDRAELAAAERTLTGVRVDQLRHVDRDANIDAARAAADGDLAPMRALLDPVVERVRQRR